MDVQRTDHAPELIDGMVAATQHRDREDIERSLVELVLQFLDADTVTLFKLEEENGERLAVPCIAARRGHTGMYVIRDSSESLRLVELPGWRLCLTQRSPRISALTPGRHEIVFPVTGDGTEPVGVLRIVGPHAPEPREIYVVGGILQIIRNHLALLEYGERDALTGLLNRKTFDSQFEKMRSQLARRAAANPDRFSWLAMVDVDHFKSINDRFGHVFGDQVLALVSQIIQRSFRGGDHIYRFGGEEFAILLHDVPGSVAVAAFERLRTAVGRHPFPEGLQVTISTGWTRLLPHDTSIEAIDRADRALYYAKKAGRDRAYMYETLESNGDFASAGGTGRYAHLDRR